MNADNIKTGFYIVVSILGLVTFLELLRLMRALVEGGLTLGTFLRLGIMLWLCWATYNGTLWARVLFSLGLLISGLLMLMAAFGMGDGLFGLIGLVQLLCGLAFWVIPAVNAYFDYVTAQSQ